MEATAHIASLMVRDQQCKVRLNSFAVLVQQLHLQSPPVQAGQLHSFCCSTSLQSLRHWIAACGSKHNGCSNRCCGVRANWVLQQQLCILVAAEHCFTGWESSSIEPDLHTAACCNRSVRLDTLTDTAETYAAYSAVVMMLVLVLLPCCCPARATGQSCKL